jgi:hypothetical protein
VHLVGRLRDELEITLRPWPLISKEPIPSGRVLFIAASPPIAAR